MTETEVANLSDRDLYLYIWQRLFGATPQPTHSTVLSVQLPDTELPTLFGVDFLDQWEGLGMVMDQCRYWILNKSSKDHADAASAYYRATVQFGDDCRACNGTTAWQAFYRAIALMPEGQE